MNSQLSQTPLASTAVGGPPQRETVNGAHNGSVLGAGGRGSRDIQEDEMSIGNRRYKDDLQVTQADAAVVAASTPPINPGANRRTMQLQQQQSPGDMGRTSPTMMRSADRKTMITGTSVQTPPANGNSYGTEVDIDPYASEAIVPNNKQQQQQQLRNGNVGSAGSYFPPPPRTLPSGSGVSLPLQNLPPPPAIPSPPTSTPVGPDKRANGTFGLPPPPPTSTMPVSPAYSDPNSRSSSPATGRVNGRVTPTNPPAGTPPHLTQTASYSQQQPQQQQQQRLPPTSDLSAADPSIVKALESKMETVQESNLRLQRQMNDREEELAAMRRRENWLVAEVLMTRQGERRTSITSLAADQTSASAIAAQKRQSMADLEKELELQPTEGLQFQMTKALLKVKEELRHAKVRVILLIKTLLFSIPC